MRNQYFVSSGYTGHIFEDEVLGTCRLKWNGNYLPFREAVSQVRESQPWSPKAPTSPVPRALLSAVSRRLSSTEVELYTAVGTALDRYHGVDGYFYFQGIMVTMDVSLKDKGHHKADLALCETDLENLGAFADKVADEFAMKQLHQQWRSK